MKTYPFKFLDSYRREDRGVFFGRDEEINALYEMVFQSAIVLVYGASGTGKTSLINCGLAGKFQSHDWLDLMIRRGSNINDSLTAALEQAGGKVDARSVESKWLDDWEDEPGKPTEELTPTARSIKAVYQKSFRPVYLIFDQFEELFILGTPSEQQVFIDTIQGVLRAELPVKLIFSIREEYLGHLFDFERAIPTLLRKKLRVEPMNLEKVKLVIKGAAAYETSNISIKAGEEDAVAEGIFHKIKGGKKSLTIQLPFLQVFLDKLYLTITRDKTRESPAEFALAKVNEMGEIGDILSNFLEEQVADISKELKGKYSDLKPELTWKILSPFATLEGTKDPITKKELFERVPDLDQQMVIDVVEAFSNSRLLRYNESTDTYEISHDSLARPIAEILCLRSRRNKDFLKFRYSSRRQPDC
ncbi:ATP-binding protein, partial [Algoriphagus jejuensis]|uniref:ATP-binding protein n=1 Tax=Algoriphagus jejuensis TaxID=419934 RepID=UPI0031DEF319